MRMRLLGLAAAGLLVGSMAAHGSTVAIGQKIVNGDFTNNLNSWVTAGASVNRRLNSDTINTSGGSAGFNSFFDSAFAVLGDLTGNITLEPWQPASSIEQSFTLASLIGGVAVIDYDLSLSFRTAFDGRDSTGALHDIFSAVLLWNGGANSITLFSQDSSGFPDGAPSTGLANNQLVNAPFSAQIFGLLPGTYTLRFVLDEKVDPSEALFTNTAAGIDTVSVTGDANLVPIPAALPLLLSGLVGLGFVARRRVGA